MYTFPDSSRMAGKWNMRPILTVEQRLKNIPYPDPSAHVQSDMGVEIKFTMPEHIYMSEDTAEVKIAIWNKEREQWSMEDTSEVAAFNHELRELKFNTNRFAPMAML